MYNRRNMKHLIPVKVNISLCVSYCASVRAEHLRVVPHGRIQRERGQWVRMPPGKSQIV